MNLSTTWEIIITGIPGLLAAFSGFLKLSGSKQVIDSLTKVGVVQYSNLLGIAEIVFAILFVFPPTNPLGFILLVCYFSGALATDLSHQRPIVAPLVILGLLFIAEFITHKALFFLI